MKVIILFIIYIFSFFGFYCLLSLGGLIITSLTYLSILREISWFLLYFVTIGWCTPLFICREYYLKHEDYFENIF
jgi:hypothetical protein